MHIFLHLKFNDIELLGGVHMGMTPRIRPIVEEETDVLQIRLDEIPESTVAVLAAATDRFIKQILMQPGGREMIEAQIEARRRRLQK